MLCANKTQSPLCEANFWKKAVCPAVCLQSKPAVCHPIRPVPFRPDPIQDTHRVDRHSKPNPVVRTTKDFGRQSGLCLQAKGKVKAGQVQEGFDVPSFSKKKAKVRDPCISGQTLSQSQLDWMRKAGKALQELEKSFEGRTLILSTKPDPKGDEARKEAASSSCSNQPHVEVHSSNLSDSPPMSNQKANPAWKSFDSIEAASDMANPARNHYATGEVQDLGRMFMLTSDSVSQSVSMGPAQAEGASSVLNDSTLGLELPKTILQKMVASILETGLNESKASQPHPRLRLFISHAGYNSILESAIRGMPMLTIPLFFDQLRNAKCAEYRGYARLMTKHDLCSVCKIRDAIGVMLNNNRRYKKAAVRLAKKFTEKPSHPRETVLRWTEFVLANGPLDELVPESVHLTLIEYFCLDIEFYTFLALAALLMLFYKCAHIFGNYLLKKRPNTTNAATTTSATNGFGKLKEV